jgi:glycosyltransferase involved in cell wall biosynthesis
MRITFLLPHAGLAGGVRVVAIYAQRLQDRGHKVVILSTPYRLENLRDRVQNAWHRLGLWMRGEQEPSHLNGIKVEHRRLPSPDHVDPTLVPEADVIIATWWETAERIGGPALPASKGVPAYFIQHYETHAGQPIERVKATWRLPMQKIVVAQWLADVARDEHGDGGAIVVPNAVDLQQFAMPPRSKQARPTVGLMHSSQQYKGSDIAVKAIEIARQSVPDLQVTAFGMADCLEDTILPADAQFTSLPAQDKLKEIYGSCDAWLFASRSEGFGLPILEAMACRTPVIATPAGAAPELVGEGGGVRVKPEDPEDMAAAIVRVMRMNDEQWKRMSDTAYATASRYTWDDATDLFEKALRKVVEDAKRTSPRTLMAGAR